MTNKETKQQELPQELPPLGGIALSGGGFRAVLFHLGVIRFLYEQRALSKLKVITSVSGGSILAAHLVLNWAEYNGDEESFHRAAGKIIQFTQTDIRSRILRRAIAAAVLIGPWLFNKILRVPMRLRQLESEYRKLFGRSKLAELQRVPGAPALHILATSLTSAQKYAFSGRGFGLCACDGADPDEARLGELQISVTKAVTASSAFPVIFPPVRITAGALGLKAKEFKEPCFLTDGGVLDNLGIEELSSLAKCHCLEDRQIWVSDAGQNFDYFLPRRYWLFYQSGLRAISMLMERAKKPYMKNRDHGFVAINDRVTSLESPLFLPLNTQETVSSARTDLNKFEDLEVVALIRHGYGVARKVWIASGRSVCVPKMEWQPLDKQVSKITEIGLSGSDVKHDFFRKFVDIMVAPSDWVWWVLVSVGFCWLVLIVVVVRLLVSSAISE